MVCAAGGDIQGRTRTCLLMRWIGEILLEESQTSREDILLHFAKGARVELDLPGQVSHGAPNECLMSMSVWKSLSSVALASMSLLVCGST